MRFQRALFLCFVAWAVCMPVAASRADDPTPMTIFQNHTNAVGYSLSDGRVKPYIINSTTTWRDYKDDQHSLKTVRKQAGSYFREDSTYSGSTDSNGFDGTSFWNSSDNGILTADTGYGRPFDVTWAVIDSEGFDATLQPELRKSTQSAYIVRIHPVGGVPADIYFDRTTSLIDQVIIDPDGDSIRQEYADYKAFGPIQVATTRRMNGTTTTVNSVSWDASVSADDLSAPPSQNDEIVFPSSGVVTVPFDPHDGVIVDATVNGVAGKFLIDPMAANTLIDPLMAQRANLVKSAVDARFAFLNATNFSGLPPATIQIGGLTLRNCHLRLFSQNFDLPDEPYDGYIGLDVLGKAVTSIDSDTNKVTFLDPAKFVAPTSEVALPIALDGGIAQVIALANGSKKVYMQLGPAFLGMTYFWQKFLEANPDIANSAGGFSGVMHSLKLGPYEQDTVQAASIRFPPGISMQTGANGIIGYGVLSDFNLILDYPDSKIFITLTKRTTP
jgi:hypothetical protein